MAAVSFCMKVDMLMCVVLCSAETIRAFQDCWRGSCYQIISGTVGRALCCLSNLLPQQELILLFLPLFPLSLSFCLFLGMNLCAQATNWAYFSS